MLLVLAEGKDMDTAIMAMKPSNIKYGDSISDNGKSDKSSKSDNSDKSNEEDKPEKGSSSWIVIACVFGALIGCIIGAVSLTKGGGDDIIVADTAAVDTISDAELEELFNAAAVRTYTVNGVSFDMVSVAGGTFTMGATSEQGSEENSDEKPAHRVTLSDYMIGKTEVTQELWQAVMGSNPSCHSGNNLPVETVSWNDCQEFIKKLNSLTGLNFRLPTEAEWEYAARGGSKSKDYKYSGSNDVRSVAWYDETTNGSGTKPVATKAPNELGLFDMSGNVREWCSDWYGDYSSDSQTNPKGPSSGSSRVLRGGRWNDYNGRGCRVSIRFNIRPDFRYNYLGLRLAL